MHDFMNLLLDNPVELRLDASIHEDIRLSQDLKKIAHLEGLGKFELETVLNRLGGFIQHQVK